MRDRHPGLRTARPDADARTHRQRPPLGAETECLRIFAVAGRLAPQRPAPAAPPRRTLALGRAGHRRRDTMQAIPSG